ncbi:P-loop containing nucleoside triphosphate hydrolase protein [Coemansia reversa NRRL 1564]|uniref:P-loop containing nucleoside triphosphate hydrolase protein n=1 Tax=Coemansia reversa (strain ATCC 12441 / NRRL 1564) TaxID=763665 RepID=A0A2G5BG38_COERN|nr:P-loop containing nucleoside triphosphate hydrolase protein [Coemansia reversa NRRL 1564]|eukprot:PIA17986.1 P-loop containing nucleoside triphosphate hydrolase protein [Coemansia reversa NRRL 1564]
MPSLFFDLSLEYHIADCSVVALALYLDANSASVRVSMNLRGKFLIRCISVVLVLLTAGQCCINVTDYFAPLAAAMLPELQLIRLGKSRDLVLEDVWQLPDQHCLRVNREELRCNFDEPLFLMRAILRWLAIISAAISIGITLTIWGFEWLTGSRYEWENSINGRISDSSINEIYSGIKAIKLFGWERMYFDPELLAYYAHKKEIPCQLRAMRSAVDRIITIERNFKPQASNTLTRSEVTSLLPDPTITMCACTFTWYKNAPNPVLKDISLSALSGKLVTVVGKTGSKKTSLLLAICGELEMIESSGGVTGNIGYLEQSPWIMDDTLRANILFGREYESQYFIKVIYACALAEDILQWPDGDMTVIGDLSVNISGGQRARLTFARTLYSRADIYILEGPLSAVDSHVKRHILDYVILETGILAGKLRIITTHSTHILPFAHQVVSLGNRTATVTLHVPQIYRQLISPPLSSSGNVISENCSSSLPLNIPENKRLFQNINKSPARNPELKKTEPEVQGGTLWDSTKYVFQICGFPVMFVALLSGLARPITRFVMDGLELKYRQASTLHIEALYVVEDNRPPLDWPHHGRIKFCNFSMRYRNGLPLALENINLTINTGEKIGIVGRTGAGKSVGWTLPLGVGDPRPRLGIIPQKSTMFSGSYKKNLDPLREFTIEDIWAALLRCGVASKVSPPRVCKAESDDDYRRKIEQYVEEKAESEERWANFGPMMRLFLMAFTIWPRKPSYRKPLKPNYRLEKMAISDDRGFSNGQQQLFSLCRLLLRKRRIIVLDEAIANVDLDTDKDIHRLIRKELSDCTVLTIAHRLETIMNSDRIVVMDKGRIAEVGPPQELLKNGGHFAELLHTSNFGV